MQAMVHSAPLPFFFLSDLKARTVLFVFTMKLSGPLDWQNLSDDTSLVFKKFSASQKRCAKPFHTNGEDITLVLFARLATTLVVLDVKFCAHNHNCRAGWQLLRKKVFFQEKFQFSNFILFKCKSILKYFCHASSFSLIAWYHILTNISVITLYPKQIFEPQLWPCNWCSLRRDCQFASWKYDFALVQRR